MVTIFCSRGCVRLVKRGRFCVHLRSVYDGKCLLRLSVRVSYKMFVLLIIDLWYEEGFLCISLVANHIEIEMKHKHEK